MKNTKIFFVLLLLIPLPLPAQENSTALSKTGEVKYWYLSGPFEQPIKGFGDIGDKEIIKEREDENQLKKSNDVEWDIKGIDKNGFVDFNSIYAKVVTDSVSKIWFVKAGYAFAVINSNEEKNVQISFGGNSITKIIHNGKLIYESAVIKNAVKDETKQNIKLRKGENYFLLKVVNSHKNFGISFFIPTNYEWGFYFRIISDDYQNIYETIYHELIKTDIEIIPTFFQKEIENKTQQKLYVDIVNENYTASGASITYAYDGDIIKKNINALQYGHNNIEIYIPKITKPGTLKVTADISGHIINKSLEVEPPVNYELYLMQLSHTDIGYTHTQPMVKERHIKTIDEVVEKCKADPNFKWTIETLWILENYRKAKKKEDFDGVIKLIKAGRIYVSPIYTNPFTGLISENEAYYSLELAKKYKKEYGIEFTAAVYNDVPGQSWFLPKVLESSGVSFLANGINEIYNDYQYQKNLPKAFIWQGADSSQVINYLTESYVEGMKYGLEYDNYVIEKRMWEEILKLNKHGYNYNIILLNAAFTDNAGIAENQFTNALKWNEEYEYPKFIISTLADFSSKFEKKYKDQLPVVKGDFTSAWDILNQGEFERSVRLRTTQRKMKNAEILSGLAWLINDDYKINSELIEQTYDNSLHLAGHGSGLEFGFGTLKENKITDDYREQYSLNAYLDAEELYERSLYELTKNMESFQNFGAIVFNTYPIQQTKIVDVAFSSLENANYSVVDLSTNQKVKSSYDGSKVSFIAESVPAYGYKKYKFVNESGTSNNITLMQQNFIENEYYKITIDETSLSIKSIYDKESKRELLSGAEYGFLALTQKNFTDSYELAKENKSNGEIVVTTGGSLSRTITIKDKYAVIPLIKVTIYNGLKLINIDVEFDYTKLGETDITQNYNLGFPLINHDSEIVMDLLGGEYNSNLKPGWMGNKAFSIRDYVRIKNAKDEIFVSSPDCRILEIVKKGNGKILVANIGNNFQKNWNRNEKNDKVIKYNFGISSLELDENNNVNSEIFGKTITDNPIVRKTWFNTKPETKNIMEIDNSSIAIEFVQPVSDDEIIIRFHNLSDEIQSTNIKSGYFTNKKFAEIDWWTGVVNNLKKKDPETIEIKFYPKETKTIMVKRNN